MPKTTTGGVNPGLLINYFRRKLAQNDGKIAPQTPQNGDFRLRRWWVNSPPKFVLGSVLVALSPRGKLRKLAKSVYYSESRSLVPLSHGRAAGGEKSVSQRNKFIAPRALATSGRRPGVRAKRAARGVAGRQVWTGRREKTAHHL